MMERDAKTHHSTNTTQDRRNMNTIHGNDGIDEEGGTNIDTT